MCRGQCWAHRKQLLNCRPGGLGLKVGRRVTILGGLGHSPGRSGCRDSSGYVWSDPGSSPTCQPLWRHLEPHFPGGGTRGGTSVACSESLGPGGGDSVGPSVMAGKTLCF